MHPTVVRCIHDATGMQKVPILEHSATRARPQPCAVESRSCDRPVEGTRPCRNALQTPPVLCCQQAILPNRPVVALGVRWVPQLTLSDRQSWLLPQLEAHCHSERPPAGGPAPAAAIGEREATGWRSRGILPGEVSLFAPKGFLVAPLLGMTIGPWLTFCTQLAPRLTKMVDPAQNPRIMDSGLQVQGSEGGGPEAVKYHPGGRSRPRSAASIRRENEQS